MQLTHDGCYNKEHIMSELAHFRQQIDDFMGHHPQSPLDNKQQAAFKGLPYFAQNDDLVFEADVERFSAMEPAMDMETSTGETRPFRRWGRFTFTINGQAASLTIYSDGHGLFLPFRDATNGRETYGAGRYLDSQRPGLEQVLANKIRVDFNFAYNPYCAYQESYSCPLPPRENWLKIPIYAGEKDFVQ